MDYSKINYNSPSIIKKFIGIVNYIEERNCKSEEELLHSSVAGELSEVRNSIKEHYWEAFFEATIYVANNKLIQNVTLSEKDTTGVNTGIGSRKIVLKENMKQSIMLFNNFTLDQMLECRMHIAVISRCLNIYKKKYVWLNCLLLEDIDNKTKAFNKARNEGIYEVKALFYDSRQPCYDANGPIVMRMNYYAEKNGWKWEDGHYNYELVMSIEEIKERLKYDFKHFNILLHAPQESITIGTEFLKVFNVEYMKDNHPAGEFCIKVS